MEIAPDRITEALRPFEPVVIYLFGSAAAGRQRSDSDLDVAFLPTAPADPYEVFQAAQQLASVFHREVDLVDLSRANEERREVLAVYSGRHRTESATRLRSGD